MSERRLRTRVNRAVRSYMGDPGRQTLPGGEDDRTVIQHPKRVRRHRVERRVDVGDTVAAILPIQRGALRARGARRDDRSDEQQRHEPTTRTPRRWRRLASINVEPLPITDSPSPDQTVSPDTSGTCTASSWPSLRSYDGVQQSKGRDRLHGPHLHPLNSSTHRSLARTR